MSTHANPDLARLWLDGDAWRAPAGTALPDDVFDPALTTPWVPFGGIKAGFTVSVDQAIKEIDVWNNTSGAAYKISKDPAKPSIGLRPVDYSKGTMLTLLRGGSVAETEVDSDIFELIEGDEEFLALILQLRDGSHNKGYYIEKCQLSTVPEEKPGDPDDVDGWDLEITPLAPGGGRKAVRKFLDFNPIA